MPPQSCERWLINPINYRFQPLFFGVSVHANSTDTILHAIRLSDPGSSFQVPRQSRSPCSRTPALEASASTAPGSVRPSSKNAWRGAEFQVTPTMGGLTWLNQGNMEMSLRFWDGIDGSNSEEFTHKIGFLAKSVCQVWLWPVYEPLRLVSPIFKFQMAVLLGSYPSCQICFCENVLQPNSWTLQTRESDDLPWAFGVSYFQTKAGPSMGRING